jgi:hypothetical protein
MWTYKIEILLAIVKIQNINKQIEETRLDFNYFIPFEQEK